MTAYPKRAPWRLRLWWVLALGALLGGAALARAMDSWWSEAAVFDARGAGRRSQAYLVAETTDTTAPLRFEIPARARELRILTTGLLDPRASRELDWTYSLEIALPSSRQKPPATLSNDAGNSRFTPAGGQSAHRRPGAALSMTARADRGDS